MHGPGQVFHQLGGRAGRLRLVGDLVREGASGQEFQGQVGQPEMVAHSGDLDDARVLKPGDSVRL